MTARPPYLVALAVFAAILAVDLGLRAGLHASEWSSWAQVAIGAGAAAVALWAAFIMKRANRDAIVRATFEHGERIEQAIDDYSALLPAGSLVAVLQGWPNDRPESKPERAIFRYLNAIETLLVAVEEGAADAHLADRILAPVLRDPTEMALAIAEYRKRGGHPDTYDAIERRLTQRSAKLSNSPGGRR